MATAFENLKQRQSILAPESVKAISAFDALKQRQSLLGEQIEPEEEAKQDGFFKSLVKAPATILARPLQLATEAILPGDNTEAIDKFSREKLGGFVAPIPKNFGDVKKDVGRGVQTVAFGMPGLASGGAAFGLGASLEQGNDLFSKETALSTAGGAVAGKLLGLVGKPLLNIAGKVIGKITPDIVKKVSSQGAKAVDDFMKQHQILPAGASKVINTGVEKLETVANKPFELAKRPFTKTPEKIIAKREEEIFNIENQYAKTRKANIFSKDAGSASRKRVAETDVLVNSVDENGLMRTKQPGGAVEQYRAQTIDGVEGVVRENLERLGEKVSLRDVEKHLIKTVNESGLQGNDLRNALNNVRKEVAGYRLKADVDGNIPLTLVHDAKISTTANINYLTPPEVKTYRKSIARGLKEVVENNSSFNAEAVNKELSKYYQDIALLERLDGARVRGGKLGKYFSQIVGNVAGGLAGGAVGGAGGSALGTIVGGEIGSRVRGSMMSKILGGATGRTAPKSPILQKASELGKSGRLLLPAPKANAPKKQFGSGQTIFLPSKSQSSIDTSQIRSLSGTQKSQYTAKPTTKPKIISISKSVPQTKTKDNALLPKEKTKAVKEKADRFLKDYFGINAYIEKGKKPKGPSLKDIEEVAEHFKQYNPKKPFTVYRGIEKGQKEGLLDRPTAWTRLKEVAEEHTYGTGKVIKLKVNPNQVLLDINAVPHSELPKDVLSKIIPDEEEIILKPNYQKKKSSLLPKDKDIFIKPGGNIK